MLAELPGMKPALILGLEGNVLYASPSFLKEFGANQWDNVRLLKSQPSLEVLVKNFIRNHYRAVQFESKISNASGTGQYIIEIETVAIGGEARLKLTFANAESEALSVSPVAMIHEALDYGNIPLLITEKDGRIAYVTNSFEKIIGKASEELAHKNLTEVLAPFLNKRALESLKKAITRKQDWRKLINDNSNTWYKEVLMNPVFLPSKDIGYFIVTANDITDLIRQTRIVEESERRQLSIINNFSDLLLIVRSKNNELLIENANDSFLKAFGAEKSFILGRHLQVVVEPELFAEIHSALQTMERENETQRTFAFEDALRKSHFTVKVTFTQDELDSSRLYILSFADITEQFRQEEILRTAYEKETQLSKLKSAFLANMSHEVRTPAMAIVGYATLLCDDVQEGTYDSVDEMTQLLKDGIKRLLKLVDNIVEVSMIESGSYNFEFQSMQFNQLINDSIEEVLPSAADKKVTIHCDFEDGLPLVEIDQSKAKKIIEAIVDNSIKYNISGGKVILKTLGSNDHVTLYVTDTGRGIDEKKLETILQPFVQEEEEGHKRRYEGAGLGLTIASRLTKALHGSFQVKSKPNQGTTVVIKFPITQNAPVIEIQ
jgi:PAS domain S-box-containing protein